MNLEEEMKKVEEGKIEKFKEKYHPIYLFKKLKKIEVGMEEDEILRIANYYERVFYEPMCKVIDYHVKKLKGSN